LVARGSQSVTVACLLIAVLGRGSAEQCVESGRLGDECGEEGLYRAPERPSRLYPGIRDALDDANQADSNEEKANAK
jgi:hypothetical protein